jgi:wax ester synthase-like acyl-CoA acyltransferase family protein
MAAVPEGDSFARGIRPDPAGRRPLGGLAAGIDAGREARGYGMERLTAQDLSMLWPDDVGWPQDIGALAIVDGGGLLDQDGRFRIEAVREAIGARLRLVPRFRQLVHRPRRGLGWPLWVDAPAFDLGQHVRAFPLPPPGDESQLLLAVERLRRRRLDRSRPLWEMWFLAGLPQGRVGLFMKVHHAIADGVAGVASSSTRSPMLPRLPVGRGHRHRSRRRVTCSRTTYGGAGASSRAPGRR